MSSAVPPAVRLRQAASIDAELPLEQRLTCIAETFPSLERAPGVSPFDAGQLHAWALDPLTSNQARHVVRLLLELVPTFSHVRWTVGRFDVVAAAQSWDIAHKAAFFGWMARYGRDQA